MNTITIPKKEYERLRERSAAYIKIVEEITKAEREYPYDYGYIDRLSREAKRGKWTEAESIDAAMIKLRKR